MNINDTRPSSTSPALPTPAKEAPPKNESSTPYLESDSFTEDSGIMSSEGKLPIILTSVPTDMCKKLKRLLCKKFKASKMCDLPLINGMSCEIEPKMLKKITKLLPPEAGIAIDTRIDYPIPGITVPAPLYKGPKEEDAKNVYAEALGLDKIWAKGYTGKGIGVAVIDSGIFSHEDFDGRIVGWKDFSTRSKDKNYDPFGHGTHVAGIVGGSGKASGGKVKGVAPDANLVGVRITSVSEAIRGLQWVIENKDKFGIKVVNMSLGDYPIKSYKDDPWAQAAEKAVEAGLVVVVAAGNEGPPQKTISTPGTDPLVMTVGSLDDKKTVATDDDTIADNSSRGPTAVDSLDKPDFVAYGVSIYAPLAPGSKLDIDQIPHIKDKYISFSGSSMATPMVAGLAVLMLSANPNLTHAQIKQIIQETAVPIPDLDKFTQGKGRIDPLRAIARAEELLKKDGKIESDKTTPSQPSALSGSEEWLIS